MRFVVLKSSVVHGTLALNALSGITQRSGGVVAEWLGLTTGNINCIELEKSDLLSFDDKEQLKEDLERWEIADENVAIIGIEADEDTTLEPE